MDANKFRSPRNFRGRFSFTISAIFTLGIGLSACEIANQKRPIADNDTSGGNTVFGFFKSQQYAINYPGLSEQLSGISGVFMVATSDGTFENWINPKPECKFMVNDGAEISASRFLDLGELKIAGFSPAESVTIPIDQYKQFALDKYLPAGAYQMQNSGTTRGGFAFNQDFTVLPAGSGIKLTSGDDGTAQPLPTPDVVGSSDPHYTAVIDKAQSLKIEYTAPENTSYVRVMLSDGSNEAAGQVVCYGPSFTPITVPAGQLGFFRDTADAYIFVDFVSVSVKTDVTGVKQSFIQSYTRHVHGTQNYPTKDGTVTLHYGELRVQ